MRRRLVALLAAASVGLGTVLGAAPASAALSPGPYQPPETGFYSVPYTSTLWWARPSGGGVALSAATLEEWASQGYPAPRPVPSLYQRYPWSSTIYGIPQIPGWRFPMNLTAVTPAGWAAAGYPQPTVTWTVAGTFYRKWVNSPVISAVLPAANQVHDLTLAEWLASGSPQPSMAGLAPGTSVYQWSTSPEIFTSLDGVVEKLTYPQWASYGYPGAVHHSGGFYKLAWNPYIAYIGSDGEYILTAQDWASEGYPTAQSAATLPGDWYCYDTALDVVSYVGLTFDDDMDPALAVQRLGVPLAQMETC